MKINYKIDDTKCAPTKVYRDGSCFTEEELKKMIIEYNKLHPNKPLNLSNNKKDLVKQLENALKDKCDDQVCWLRQDFLKNLQDVDLKKNTFRPVGPSGKYDWLSTLHINDVIKQYQLKYPDFIFLGAVPLDFEDLPILGIKDLDFKELENKGKYRIGIVFNLDEHWKSGSHWTASYIDLKKNQVYYFDSSGSYPPKRIRKFLTRVIKYIYQRDNKKKINFNNIIEYRNNNINDQDLQNLLQNIDIRYNTTRHQFGNEECGVYSISFILRLLNGETFNDIINKVVLDKEINECRKKYFINL